MNDAKRPYRVAWGVCSLPNATSKPIYPSLRPSHSALIIGDIVRDMRQRAVSRAFVRAGPRSRTYFDPSKSRAAIVTCGGLCPGLNNVIRELVDTLTFGYGTTEIYGVQNGYWGFHTPDAGALGGVCVGDVGRRVYVYSCASYSL